MNPETTLESPVSDTNLPSIFNLGANALLNRLAELPEAERAGFVAEALTSAFDSGFTSGAVQSEITTVSLETLAVPANGMLLFRLPADSSSERRQRFTSALTGVAEQLRIRLGFDPVMLVLPNDIEAQAVTFEEGFKAGQLIEFPTPKPAEPLMPRAFDALAFSDLLSEIPFFKGVEAFSTGSVTRDGVCTHDVRVVVPNLFDLIAAHPDRRTPIPSADTVVAIEDVADTYAKRIGAALSVTVVVDGYVATPDAPTFSVDP